MNDGLDDLATFDDYKQHLARDAPMEEYFNTLCLMAQDVEALSAPEYFDHANPTVASARIELVRSRVLILERFLRLCTERLAN